MQPSTEEEPSVSASAAQPATVNKPHKQVSPFVESIYTHPTSITSEEYGLRRDLHVQLSSSRLRKLSDVEECEVQPDHVSNFPLRYGQRRPSNTSSPVSFIYPSPTSSHTITIMYFSLVLILYQLSNFGRDPFTFNFESQMMARRQSQKRDMNSVEVRI